MKIKDFHTKPYTGESKMQNVDMKEIFRDVSTDIHNKVIAETIIMLYIKTIHQKVSQEQDFLYDPEENTQYLIAFDFEALYHDSTIAHHKDMNTPFHTVYKKFVPYIVQELNRDFRGVLQIVNDAEEVGHKIVFGTSEYNHNIYLKAIPLKENNHEKN